MISPLTFRLYSGTCLVIAASTLAWSSPGFAQAPDHKQRALDELGQLECNAAKPYIDMYRDQAKDKQGPVVLELEKRLALCYETDEKSKKLVDNLDLAIRTQQFGAAELLTREFAGYDKRAAKKYGKPVSDAAAAIEKYWQDVRENVEKALDVADFTRANALLEECPTGLFRLVI